MIIKQSVKGGDFVPQSGTPSRRATVSVDAAKAHLRLVSVGKGMNADGKAMIRQLVCSENTISH